MFAPRTATSQPAASSNLIAEKPISGRIASIRQVTNSPTFTLGIPASLFFRIVI